MPQSHSVQMHGDGIAYESPGYHHHHHHHHHHLLRQKAAHKHFNNKLTHNHETSKNTTQILLKAPPKTLSAEARACEHLTATDRSMCCLGRRWSERNGPSSSRPCVSGGQSLADHSGDEGGSGDMDGGSDGHAAGGMNVGKAATATAAGNGVLIAVRFARADMSAQHEQHSQILTALWRMKP